jgi:hypothetical protein
MNFLLAGEGSSDLGSLDTDGSLKKGPMAFVVDALCQSERHVSPNYVGLLSHTKLSRLAAKVGRGGPERPVRESALVYDQAVALAREAKSRSGCCGSIFFQDCDREAWGKLYEAMRQGFKAGGMEHAGVPMIPKPKSEAWFLAYYQKNETGQRAYNNSRRFEEMSGNDASPKSVKKKLAKMLECAVREIYDKITEDEIRAIKWTRVDMPSFKQFKEDLFAAVDASAVTP